MRMLLLVLFFTASLFAIDRPITIEAVEANPSFLNTSQTHQISQKKKVSIEQVLKKLNSKQNIKKNSEVKVENKVENKVDKVDETKIETEKQNKEEKVSTTLVNRPLSYINEKKLIKQIQSIQQKKLKVKLNRYGDKFFYNKNSLNSSILAVPDYYTLNPNDTISVQIFGGMDKTFNLIVNNNGSVTLPVLGPIYVAGMSVAQVKELLKGKLKPIYRNSKILVDVKVNSFIQVTLTGFVKAPGIYNLNSLSTIKDLLIAANGFGKLGSMREVYLKRGGKTIKIIDFYKLIKNGDVVDTTLLRNGDIVFVPKAKILVNLSGAVSIPAIYEMKKNEILKDLINFAGGIIPNGSKKEIKIKRFENNSYTKILFRNLDDNFHFKNGDDVYVYKISELNRDYVYVYGNVEKPGSYEMPKDRKLKTLLKKVTFLQNAYKKYGLVKKFDGKIISFSLDNIKNIMLSSKDSVFIFNKYEILPEEYVTIKGKVVRNPGKYRWFSGETLKDVVNNAGIKGVVDNTKVQIIRYNENLEPILLFVNFMKNPNFKLEPFDEITLYDYYEMHPLNSISIKGEVNQPGTYLYTANLTLRDLLKRAGWFTYFADKNYIEIKRYYIKNGMRKYKILNFTSNDLETKLYPYDEVMVNKIPANFIKQTVSIKGEVLKSGNYNYIKNLTLKDLLLKAGWFTDKADKNYIELVRHKVVNDSRKRKIIRLSNKNLDFKLLPYDEVFVRKIPNWNDRKTITISGEVKYPGVYPISKGDKLSDIIKRAGGFTKDAYLYGAVFTRESVRKMQEKRLKTMIYKLKKKVAVISASVKGAGETSMNAKNMIDAIDSLAVQAEKLKPIGRVALIINKDMNKFAKSPYNILLQNKDKLYIPTKSDSIIVMGEVLTPTAFAYTTDSSLKYIKKAGGRTDMADDIYFVVHANGFTDKGEFGWFNSNVKVKAGDAITVPITIKTFTWYGMAKDITSIIYQLAISAASLKTVGALW